MKNRSKTILYTAITIITIAILTETNNAFGYQYNSISDSTTPTATTLPINLTVLEFSIITILGLTILLTVFVVVVRLQVKQKLVDFENKMASHKS